MCLIDCNAEHFRAELKTGMINLSHFAIFDIEGPDAERFFRASFRCKIGGDTPNGKMIYTNFLNEDGGSFRLNYFPSRAKKYRVVTGGADAAETGDQKPCDDLGLNAEISIRTHDIATLGLWGPKEWCSRKFC